MQALRKTRRVIARVNARFTRYKAAIGKIKYMIGHI